MFQCEDLAKALEDKLEDFNGECRHMSTGMEEQEESLKNTREKLSDADDLTGSDEQLVQRLKITKVNHKYF